MKKMYFVFLISLLLGLITACSQQQTYEEAVESNIGETEVVIGNSEFTIAPDVLHLTCPTDTSEWQIAKSVTVESYTVTIGYLENMQQVNVYDNTVRGMERKEPLVNKFKVENKYKIYHLVNYGPAPGGMEIRIGYCNNQYVYQVEE